MEHIVVVGAGTMGAQIAMVCALAGHDTTVADVADDALNRAEATLPRAGAPATTSTRPSPASRSPPTWAPRRPARTS